MNYISLLLYAVLAIFIKERTEFGLFFAIYSAIFAVYYWQFIVQEKELNKWWLWAIAFRLPFILSIPYLSDDFYRFIWDGLLQNQGINPFLHLPSEISNSISQQDIYQKLNSQNYYSVYPPLNQFLFAVATYFSPQSIIGQVIGLRVLLWAFEFGVIWLMFKIIQKREILSLFALNPLLIIESTGNLHFEIVIVFFVLLAYFSISKFPKSWYLSAISLGAAISVKLIPVLFLPLVFFRLKPVKGTLFAFVSAITLLISFYPFWSQELANNFLESVDLFFRNFEFNASIYYVVREVGFWLVGYNVIHLAGMGLKILSGLLILFISYKSKDLAKAVLAILFIYLAFATTVHPWYLIPLIAACSFTNIRFPIVWSFVVVLSYHAYGSTTFYENLWLVSLEYAVLFTYIIYENRKGLLKLW
ncbi:hypothetical protein SAMN06298216_2202 [Spirosomataceae bacterium TFI 002]|nr:hypothetical protein SAMN06298216_2202 [Spirosomataceae bacterium TFI 002]